MCLSALKMLMSLTLSFMINVVSTTTLDRCFYIFSISLFTHCFLLDLVRSHAHVPPKGKVIVFLCSKISVISSFPVLRHLFPHVSELWRQLLQSASFTSYRPSSETLQGVSMHHLTLLYSSERYLNSFCDHMGKHLCSSNARDKHLEVQPSRNTGKPSILEYKPSLHIVQGALKN